MSTDVELVQRACGGDKEAFGELIVRHQPAVTGFLLGVLRDLAEAEDASQEAFVKAFRTLPSFEGRSSFRTWVTRIALNAARSRRRWRALRFWLSPEKGNESSRPWEDRLLSGASEGEREALERRLQLEGAMEGLAPREREIVALRLEGYALGEIASVLGIRDGTVKAALFSATQKMRREFL